VSVILDYLLLFILTLLDVFQLIANLILNPIASLLFESIKMAGLYVNGFCLDFDIIYLASTGLDIDKLKDEGFKVDEPSKIKISIGYRHSF